MDALKKQTLPRLEQIPVAVYKMERGAPSSKSQQNFAGGQPHPKGDQKGLLEKVQLSQAHTTFPTPQQHVKLGEYPTQALVSP